MRQSERAEAAREVHGRLLLVDGHCDAPYRLHRHQTDLGERDATAQVTLESLRKGNVGATFFVVYVPPVYAGNGAARFARRLFDIVDRQVDRYEEDLAFADSTGGIEKARASGRTAILIGVEGGHAIEDSLEVLDEFHERGARYMTLTHVNNNNWADSSGEPPRHGGLTAFGREVVRRMNRIGMIVDVSHVSDDTFDDVLEETSVPVIASHSSCRALAAHPRNLTDRMLRDLAKNGGVCMINFFTGFLVPEAAEALTSSKRNRSHAAEGEFEEIARDRRDWEEFISWWKTLGVPPGDVDTVVDHIVHAASIAGLEHVGIGTDFDGVPSLPAGLETPRGLVSLTERLLARDFREEEIRAIYGSNFMRVFGQVESAARP